MQKKLLAAAVASALAVPGLAMAQSSVTISGVFKVGIDSYRISNPAAARNGLNTSETRVTDNSSRIIFGITEDIGGGLSGIGQLDVRPVLSNNNAGSARTGFSDVAGGNSWVGVRSTSWGTVTLGRHDLHYGKQPDDTAVYAGALMASSVSLMDYVQTTAVTAANSPTGAALGSGNTAIAGATLTNNVVRYDSPTWSGFNFTAAYSANPTTVESDLTSAIRRGSAWTINPQYTASNWQLGYSYWNQKSDGNSTGVAAAPTGSIALAAANGTDQKSNVFYGYMLFGGFKVGLAVNKSQVDTIAAATGTLGGSVRVGDRTAWTIPVRWESGPHFVTFHYTKAGNNKAPNAPGSDGARMWAATYSYLLSKRTSVGFTIADLNNDNNAQYNFFTNTGGLGSFNSTLGLGEDARLYALTVRHAF